MRRLKKRGQEGGSGAAALVALIATFILLFIVFLPPSERAKLLDDTGTGLVAPGGGDNLSEIGNYILLENPGTVLPPFASSFTYPIAPIEVSASMNAVELERAASVIVKKSLFTTQQQEIQFSVDPDVTDAVLLNFKTIEAGGNLHIDLNGNPLFNREITTPHIDPISLPTNSLKEDNVLTFSADPVGAAFWVSNKYRLEDVTVTGQVQDLSNTIGESTFYVPRDDVGRLKISRLFFLPVCSGGAGKLKVSLNGVQIYNSKPVCDSLVAIEFSPTLLDEGNNKVRFQTDEGAFSLNRMRVSSEPRDSEEYVYYFKIGPRLFDDIYFGRTNIIASLKFTDGNRDKEGKLVINGYIRSFDVRESGYALDISDFIEEGFNSIQLIPEEPLQVVELRVAVE